MGFLNSFIGVKLIHNAVLVSGVQKMIQLYIYIDPLSF